MSGFGCSFPGCDRHPSKGDTIIRISAKGPGQEFVGRCEEHYGDDSGPSLAREYERAVERQMLGRIRVKVDGVPVVSRIEERDETP